MIKIEGRYLSGQTSKHQIACLEVREDKTVQVTLSESSNQVYLDASDIIIASRLGNTPREITLGDGQLFITDDNAGADQLSGLLFGNPISLIHRLESNLPVIIISLMVTILFVIGGMKYGVPKAAEVIAHSLPDFTIEKFNDGLTLLDETMFEPSDLDPAKETEIRALFQPYLDDHAQLKPSLHFRGGMGPNAFALPGGEIVFTDEFIELIDNHDELVSVLLHELGHLKHKHLARRAIQDVLVTLMVVFIVGDINSVDMVAALPTILLDLSYSREFEREADQYSLEQMHARGIPLESFSSVMTKLHQHSHSQLTNEESEEAEEEEFEIPVYLSTHPGVEERIQLADQFKARQLSQN